MKRIKMVLYGEPGTGKSVFCCKAPKAFSITTDGNYEWLEEFGAKKEDHIQVSSWDEAKKAFASDFNGYETIVVDLVEDLFKWCEMEFCTKNKISHIGDLGFGKGYDLTRNEFFIEICKLFNKDKNVILISHGQTVVEKDRRGVEHTKYEPSPRIPSKLWDMIEGRTRYFLRCYLKGEEVSSGDNNTVIKRRYLSFIPKENEFGVCRGVNESLVPQDIPLEWNDFAKLIGIDQVTKKEAVVTPEVKEVKEESKVKEVVIPKQEPKDEVPWVEEKKEEPKYEPTTSIQEPKKEEPKKELTQAERIAMIKAKIAQQKAMNK